MRGLAFALAAAMSAMAAPPPAYAAESDQTVVSDQTTPAERLLFETDHLANLTQERQLSYRFTKEGDESYTDRIILTLKRDGQQLHVEPDFLSGTRHIGFPGVDAAHGNPLLLYFLEADLRDMQRQTEGHADYFRRVVRRALASPDLSIEEKRVEVDGRSVRVQSVRFAPYRGDAKAAERYPELRDKVYEFVFSDEVPGHIVSLQTSLTSTKGVQQIVRAQWTASQ